MDKTEEGPSDGQDGGGSKIRATQEPRKLEVIGRELRPRQRNDVKERAVRGNTIIRGYITSYHLTKTLITGMRDSSDVARARTCNYTKRSSGKESARRVTVAE